jgi:tight adherence protein C
MSTYLKLLWSNITKNKIRIEGRLKHISKKEVDEKNELNKPFKERVLKPFFEKMSIYLSKLMPNAQRNNLKKKLLIAGTPFKLKTHEFICIQYFFAAVISVIFAGVFFIKDFDIKRTVLMILLISYISYKLPLMYLKIKEKKRKKEIDKSLPDIIDLLTVSVEAGLGFDAALAKVTVKIKGVLSDEFRKVLTEVKLGKTRREALKNLVYRTGAEDLSNFVSAVLQADGLGVSMSQILRIQSEQMRRKRRQRAEEEAMKAPIKMLFPMVFFIFPCIFIVLLGPAIIKIFTELF